MASWGYPGLEKHDFPILALLNECDVSRSSGFLTPKYTKGQIIILPVDHYLSLLFLMICICFNKKNI